MTTQNTAILDLIDPEIVEPLAERQVEISNGPNANSKLVAALALGAIPVALGVLSKDAHAQATADVNDALQFALLLEYLEAEFYNRGAAAFTAMAVPTPDRSVIGTIQSHENAHVTALRNALIGRSQTPITKPTFDFTAKGAVPGFNFAAGQYPSFLALAQAFEDTGVRAYKGQAGRLINDKAILTTALTIHAVEARHAAQIRKLRGAKGWITGNSIGTGATALPAFTQPIYNGEENTTQAGMNITALGTNNGGVDAVTEAFDEPLTKAQVTLIVNPFLA